MDNILINGKIMPRDEAVLHVTDLSIHRGYGVFDFFKIKDGANPWLDHYLDRFFGSLSYSLMNFPFHRDDVKSMILEVLKANQQESGYIKMIATGGYSDDGYSPGSPSNFMIFFFPLTQYSNKPEGQGYNLISSEFQRPNPLVKSTNYFNSVLHYPKMKEYDAADVLYHSNGLLSECSRCNVFIIRDKVISTPDRGMLEGITRHRILEQKKNGFEIEERPVNTIEIFLADEIFISSSTKGVMPIVTIDGKKIGDGSPGPLSLELSKYLEVF